MAKSVWNTLCIFTVLLFVTGCGSEPEAPATEPAKPDTVPQAKVKTTGVVEFDGVPLEGLTFMEVATYQELPEETLARLKMQRELFEVKISGDPYALEIDENNAISRQDALELTERLSDLYADFPQILAIDFDLGNNRLRKLRSDSGLHEAYDFLFKSIKLQNLDRAIEVIDDKIQEDLQKLDAIAGSEDKDRSIQARHDLKWLEQVHTKLSEYLPVAKDSILAQQKYNALPIEHKSWEAYSTVYSAVLLSDVYTRCLGAAEVAADKSFVVEGEGSMIVRLDYADGSVYFLPGTEGETRVTIRDLKVVE